MVVKLPYSAKMAKRFILAFDFQAGEVKREFVKDVWNLVPIRIFLSKARKCWHFLELKDLRVKCWLLDFEHIVYAVLHRE